LGGAKNIGLENSHGRYVWFLDVDDNPSDDFLSVMVDSLESSESQVAVCNFIYSKEEKGPDGERKGSDIVLTGRQAMHARSLNLIPVASWSMLYDLRTVMDNGIRFP
jgi:glycosyltransferase involved in cell wall biosynthesis